ncbi:pyridoxal-phosphate dependent enzyme [Streptomyces sp. NPDC059743]|uniref:pyridoxal-phosphate dependent enzyme n=1 Tax=Streptomyces sp. NPDC059743 TaxID=3346928 RepID=UPI00365FF110
MTAAGTRLVHADTGLGHTDTGLGHADLRLGPADVRLGHADVLAAAERIAPYIRRTPLLTAGSLPGVLLKAEHLQHSGSFKLRGAANALLALGAHDIVTGSSGNHGLAVAALAGPLGVRVTVVMAAGASEAKARAVAALGARVIRSGGGVAERDRYARDFAERTGAVLVPSSDHELVAAGQGTVALEIFEDAPGTDTVFVPTGGGGLLGGVCLAAAGLTRPVRIVGVEPAGTRRYARALAAGHPVELPPSDTVADGLRGQRAGEILFPVIRQRVDELVGVTDEAIVQATGLLHAAGIPAEPSGAVALAGALHRGFDGTAAVIVSGGNDPAALAARTAAL